MSLGAENFLSNQYSKIGTHFAIVVYPFATFEINEISLFSKTHASNLQMPLDKRVWVRVASPRSRLVLWSKEDALGKAFFTSVLSAPKVCRPLREPPPLPFAGTSDAAAQGAEFSLSACICMKSEVEDANVWKTVPQLCTGAAEIVDDSNIKCHPPDFRCLENVDATSFGAAEVDVKVGRSGGGDVPREDT